MSYFQGKGLDHGCFSPLSLLWPHEPTWPGAIVPLQVGVLEFPIPSARRCFKLGQSLRKAIESYPEDLKVAHRRHRRTVAPGAWRACGFNNTPWDMEFLDLLEKDPEALTKITIAEYAERGGFEGSEVIMWLIMRGALSKKVKKLHQAYYLPSMTPIATVIYENDSEDPVDESVADYRTRIGTQWAGIEKLPGTYPFTLDRSVKAYRLNNFLHELIKPEARKRFLADPEPMFEAADLTDGRARHGAPAGLARAHPVRRDFLPAGEARRRGRHDQPAHLCRHARAVPGGLPEDAQRAGALLGGGTGRRQEGLGQAARGAARVGVRPWQLRCQASAGDARLEGCPVRLLHAREGGGDPVDSPGRGSTG